MKEKKRKGKWGPAHDTGQKRIQTGEWRPIPDPGQVERAIEASMEFEMPCVICNKPTYNRSIYAPSDPVAAGIGAPVGGPNRMRFMIYAVCDHCLTIPNYMGMVEFSVKAAGPPAQEDVWDGPSLVSKERGTDDANQV